MLNRTDSVKMIPAYALGKMEYINPQCSGILIIYNSDTFQNGKLYNDFYKETIMFKCIIIWVSCYFYCR